MDIDLRRNNMHEWVDVTDRHIRDFGEAKLGRYFELHYLNNGNVVRKCRDTWNCDCKKVLYKLVRSIN